MSIGDHVPDTEDRRDRTDSSTKRDHPTRHAPPVYWGTSGTLRPDAWKPEERYSSQHPLPAPGTQRASTGPRFSAACYRMARAASLPSATRARQQSAPPTGSASSTTSAISPPSTGANLNACPQSPAATTRPGSRRVVGDPEVAVERVAVQAERVRDDRRVGERREMIAHECPEPRLLCRQHRCAGSSACTRRPGPWFAIFSVPSVERGKPVPAGARDVGGPDRKARRLPAAARSTRQMNDRLTDGPHDADEMRQQRRRPRAGGHEHRVGAQLRRRSSARPRRRRPVSSSRSNAVPLEDHAPAAACPDRDCATHLRALDPAGARVEVAVGILARGSSREIGLSASSAAEPLGAMAARSSSARLSCSKPARLQRRRATSSRKPS